MTLTLFLNGAVDSSQSSAATSPSVKPDGAFIRARLSSFKSIKKLVCLGICKAASVSSTLPPAWLMPVQGWTAPVLGGATYSEVTA